MHPTGPGGACTGLASGEPARKTTGPTPLTSVCFGCRRVDVVGVETELIVDLALFRIAEDFVGLRDGLEFLFGCLVARIDIRMVLAGEFAKGLFDLVGGCAFLDSQRTVIIFVGRCGHDQLLASSSWHSALNCSLDGRVPARANRDGMVKKPPCIRGIAHQRGVLRLASAFPSLRSAR